MSLESATMLSCLTGMGVPDSARISQEEWWPESNGGTLTFMEVLSAMGTPIGIGMSCQGS